MKSPRTAFGEIDLNRASRRADDPLSTNSVADDTVREMRRGATVPGLLVAGALLGVALGGSPAVAVEKKTVATDLAFPAAFTFAPGGNIFYGERFTGEIRILNPKQDTDRLFFTVPDVVADGERGLLGLALHPDYPDSPYVYAYATREVPGGLRNQIVRITNQGGKGTGLKVIFSSGTGVGVYHDGGRILFGPDGNLYAIVGEGHSPSNAQSLENPAGKILRMTPLGKGPDDNPFEGSRIFAYGIRNSFGFTFDPRTDRLWETENGPQCNDELNHIVAGGNYGWGPTWTCDSPPDPPDNTNRDGADPIRPKRWYSPPIAPTGVAFCERCRLGPGSNGRLFFGAWNTGEIRRVTLTPNRLGVASQKIVFTHDSGILSIEVGPGGRLYFSDPTAIYKLVRG
jgi:glucose/arabinose dehydrogenase